MVISMPTAFLKNAADLIYLNFKMFIIPLSRKSVVVLKSVALKSMKEGAASDFYPGSGMVEGVGDSSFGPFFFLERKVVLLVIAATL